MKKGVPYNILGMISSQQNASPGQECRNTLDKARKLSLPGKAAELVDDIETHRGIITKWLQEKCVDREEVFFHGLHRWHVFFRLLCRNGFYSHKSKLIVLKVFLNFVWCLQDGLWNSMQYSGTEIGNGTRALWHIVFFASSPQICTQHDKDNLIMRPGGRHSTFHVEKQQLSTFLENTCLLMVILFSHTQTEYEFQDLCIILLIVYNCFGYIIYIGIYHYQSRIYITYKYQSKKSNNQVLRMCWLLLRVQELSSRLWISVVGWLVLVLRRQLQYSAIWWNIYARPST